MKANLPACTMSALMHNVSSDGTAKSPMGEMCGYSGCKNMKITYQVILGMDHT